MISLKRWVSHQQQTVRFVADPNHDPEFLTIFYHCAMGLILSFCAFSSINYDYNASAALADVCAA